MWDGLQPTNIRLALDLATEPEDITNEVFLSAFTTIGAFAGDEPAFRAHVYTIAYRRWVDELRRRSRRPDQVAWDHDLDPGHSRGRECHADELAGSDWARSLIEALSPDQRDILLLRVFGDLTHEQIARMTNRRPGAVKALQRRGLATLRRQLAQLDASLDQPAPRLAVKGEAS